MTDNTGVPQNIPDYTRGSKKYIRLYRVFYKIYPTIQGIPQNIPDYTGGFMKYTPIIQGVP